MDLGKICLREDLVVWIWKDLELNRRNNPDFLTKNKGLAKIFRDMLPATKSFQTQYDYKIMEIITIKSCYSKLI